MSFDNYELDSHGVRPNITLSNNVVPYHVFGILVLHSKDMVFERSSSAWFTSIGGDSHGASLMSNHFLKTEKAFFYGGLTIQMAGFSILGGFPTECNFMLNQAPSKVLCSGSPKLMYVPSNRYDLFVYVIYVGYDWNIFCVYLVNCDSFRFDYQLGVVWFLRSMCGMHQIALVQIFVVKVLSSSCSCLINIGVPGAILVEFVNDTRRSTFEDSLLNTKPIMRNSVYLMYCIVNLTMLDFIENFNIVCVKENMRLYLD